MSTGCWRWQFTSNFMKCKAWNRKTDQMGNEYKLRKGLKIESYDLNLQREGTPQRKQRWNGHVLTAQERVVRKQRWKGCNPLRLNAFMDM